VGLLYQWLIYPVLVNKIGVCRSVSLALGLASIHTFFWPSLVQVKHTASNGVFWSCLCFFQITRTFIFITAFTSILIVLNNSATRHNRGIVNGCGQSLAALCRVLGPLAGGGMWALIMKVRESVEVLRLTLGPVTFTFDFLSSPYYIISFLTLVACLIACRLPTQLNVPVPMTPAFPHVLSRAKMPTVSSFPHLSHAASAPNFEDKSPKLDKDFESN